MISNNLSFFSVNLNLFCIKLSIYKNNKIGDIMRLVYIENRDLLTKIITYLDNDNVEYTTNINKDFKILIIAQNNKKTLELIKLAKKVIYIAYLDEIKISNSYLKKGKKNVAYKNKMLDFFSNCNIIVTSLPYIKKVINQKKVVVIPLENLCIGLCKNKLFNLRKKVITIIDSNYKYLDVCFDMINKFSNYQYQLIGFNPNPSNKNSFFINDIPSNLKLYKYCNERILENYLINSNLVIFFDDILESQNYLNICLNLKKNLLILNSELCYDYLIDNKNVYLFDLANFLKKYKRIINNRVCNLGIEGYNLVKDNNFEKIADKFCKLLK